jgi:aminoglycoside/choline kinase family phosphotransferase
MLEEVRRFVAACGLTEASIEPLPGDLSQRHYLRVRTRDGASVLVAHYPPEMREAERRFAAAAELLAAAGVRVPSILGRDPAVGLVALEDLGESTVYDLALAGEPVDGFVADALEQARRIATLDARAVDALGCPPLDTALLARELQATYEHVLDPRGLAGLGEPGRRFREALGELCRRLGEEPPVPCHRDFMARNLMPIARRRVVVIDFQDLRLGPPGYDRASLLNDSLFPPGPEEAAWLAQSGPPLARRESYPRAVVQRTLKAAGTFARFAAAGKRRHLPLIAPTLARAVPHLARLEETAGAFAAIEGWWHERLVAEPFC